jgi:hypothetical protein
MMSLRKRWKKKFISLLLFNNIVLISPYFSAVWGFSWIWRHRSCSSDYQWIHSSCFSFHERNRERR